MRIAYITDQVLPRTATDTRQMMAMSAAMGRAGAVVDLIVPERSDRAVPDVEALSSWYEVTPSFRLTPVRTLYPSIRGLEKIAQGIVAPETPAAHRADLVYTRTLPILLGALQAGRPVVYESYRPWPDQKPISAPIFRWIGRQKNFVGAVLHSHLARESYVRAGVPDERLLTAWNGYDPGQLEPALTAEEARRALGLEDEPTVVYTGRVSMRKGLGLVLDMARKLPDARFVIVGSENEHGAVERQAATLPNVRVAPWGPISETIPYLYAADVLVIPPSSDPLRKTGNTVLPIKTFLYMAAGRAILAPGTPDLIELLEDGRNAALVQPDDASSSTRVLRDLLDDPGKRQRLAAEALRDSRELTWDRRAERVLGFIRSRLGRIG
ncbi:MAG: glycosyltransferase [Rhodothermales bacterium]|nr:glycosyltransferase [Rhodothermales bacterium]